MNVQKQRKQNRLQEYDYSQAGTYFLTICTQNRKNLFRCVGATFGRPHENLPLSNVGRVVQQELTNLNNTYQVVHIDKFCIMPNHIHLLLTIQSVEDGRPQVAPTVSRVMQQFKGAVTKKLGRAIWQKSFYDHVVRNEADYLACWKYIDENPLKWREDELYTKE